jgi:hypothetical protein
MVTTDIAQLSSECNAWRETLRSYREKFGHMKQNLQELAGRQILKDDLLQVEHLDNQLHIQLINIHDLKQVIKSHERKVQDELSRNHGRLSDQTLAYHEHVFEEYQRLEHMLEELVNEFEFFTSKV